MKKIVLGMLLTISLYANIEITQNIKALYKGVKLTEVQKDYILDNQDANSEVLKKVLNKDIKKMKLKFLDEKNVVSFILTPSGKAKNIELLQESNNRKLNRLTKKAIKEASHEFIKPKKETNVRFIISYRVNQSQKSSINQAETKTKTKPYYQNIPRGTTRFEHSSDEYIRTFQTSKDGFINLSVSPRFCMSRATLLTDNGQRIKIATTYLMYMNEEIPKGKYKILFKTKKTCNVNLEYQ